MLDHSDEVSIIHVYLDLIAELLDFNSNTLTFFPYMGIAKDWKVGMRGLLNVADNANILANNYDE